MEINGERIIISFRSKKQKPINAIETLEKELFKKNKAIVKLNNKNNVINVDDIERFLISQAIGPIQNEVCIRVLNAYSSAYNRFTEWQKNISDSITYLK